MKAEFILTNDGHAVFTCQGSLTAPVVSVEFYKETGSFVFNYDNDDHETEMVDLQLEETYRQQVATMPKALVASIQDDQIIEAFDVPFIHVG